MPHEFRPHPNDEMVGRKPTYRYTVLKPIHDGGGVMAIPTDSLTGDEERYVDHVTEEFWSRRHAQPITDVYDPRIGLGHRLHALDFRYLTKPTAFPPAQVTISEGQIFQTRDW